MPNRSRQKGDRFERACIHDLKELGVPAERVPLSGAAGGSHTDDLDIVVCGERWKAECKTRARAWSDLFGWISRSDRRPPDVLLIKSDRTATLVVMPLETFGRLAQGIL